MCNFLKPGDKLFVFCFCKSIGFMILSFLEQFLDFLVKSRFSYLAFPPQLVAAGIYPLKNP